MRLQNDLEIPDLEDIQQAQKRIRGQVRETPVLDDPGLRHSVACALSCKCENLQRSGAFKFRGASNAVARLRERGLTGDVATHSSGNHGAALALAASIDGRGAHVVMPENASPLKIAAVRSYGGIVHFCEPTQRGREQALEQLVTQGRIPVHPYDDADIIAGQGTAALELLESDPGLEQLITPLGGGGLVSGTAIAAAARQVKVYAVEPEGAADTVASLERGRIVDSWSPDTIADGLRAIVGQRNFSVIREQVAGVLTVSDDEIRAAMLIFWRELRMLIEPSAATVIAAVKKHPEIFSSKQTGAIISGGNIHPELWLELTSGKRS